MLTILGRDGKTPVGRWQDWTRPKLGIHWKPGRSAMELARAWFRTGRLAVPAELRAALDATPRMASLEFTRGEAERLTKLPERGERRNHDLLLWGTLDGAPVVLGVEAKADEPFGKNGVTVFQYCTKAIGKRAAGTSTRIPERIEALLGIVSGARTHPASSPWQGVPYQLLAAVAGLHLEATRGAAAAAVLIVHEFLSGALDRRKLETNRKAFDSLVSVLLGETVATTPGRIYGPVTVNTCQFWVGKVTCNV